MHISEPPDTLLAQILGRSGLNSVQRASLAALVQWKSLFSSHQEDADSSDLPAESLISGGSGCGESEDMEPLQDLDNVAAGIEARIASDPGFATAFLENPIEALARAGQFPPLGETHSRALRTLTSRHASGTSIDFERLQAAAPFDLSSRFFGRYLLGTEDPLLAARHLQDAKPFLHVLKGIIEAVADPQVGIVELAFDTRRVDAAEAKIGEKTLFEVVSNAVAGTDQLLSISDREIRPMAVVGIPDLPQLIDPGRGFRDRFDLFSVAEDLAGWVLKGDRRGRSLHSTRLYTHTSLFGLLGHRDILSEFERHHPKSLVDLDGLCDQYAHAAASGKRIVFRYTPQAGDGFDPVGFLLNAALHLEPEQESPCLRRLVQAGFILNQAGKERIIRAAKMFSESRDADVLSRRIRSFQIVPDHLSRSALIVLDPFLEKPAETEQQTFRAALLGIVPLPGIQGEHAEFHFSRYCARRFPGGSSLAQDVEVLFQYASSVSQEQFLAILLLLRQHGVHELTKRCVGLGEDKFRLSTDVLDKYRDYCEYRPVTVGKLHEFFEDAATFNEYTGIGLDACGLREECDLLEERLTDANIVVVVDNTSYHPELVPEVQGSTIQSDVESSQEVWGDYVRPGRRLINGLVRRIVSGQSHAFRNWSVVRTVEPSRLDAARREHYRKVFGIDVGLHPSIDEMSGVLEGVSNYNDHTVVILDAESIKDMKQLGRLLDVMNDRSFKVIVRSPEPVPGLPQVLLMPWTEAGVENRLRREREEIAVELGLSEPVGDEVLEFICDQVGRFRDPQGDPLNFATVILHAAAHHARVHGGSVMTRQDVVRALPPIFHLPDVERARHVAATMDEFAERAPMAVLGQKEAIDAIYTAVTSHLMGTRDPGRPLSILIPGPTGVGKTELLEILAHLAGVPFMRIQGSHYVEEHSSSGLFGSPTGYVGPDQGPLYRFIKENPLAIVFLDEFEKMHPAIRKKIMDLVDKGRGTAGDGETCSRPGIMVFAATNAGAEKLVRGMSDEQLKKLLAQELKVGNGPNQPEIVARFQVCAMPAIEEDAFSAVIRNTLSSLGGHYGVVSANIEIVGIDDQAVKLLYEAARDVCRHQQKAGGIGFKGQGYSIEQGRGIDYYDMRYVFAACDKLTQGSVVDVVRGRHASGESGKRQPPKRMQLVAHPSEDRILLVDAPD